MGKASNKKRQRDANGPSQSSVPRPPPRASRKGFWFGSLAIFAITGGVLALFFHSKGQESKIPELTVATTPSTGGPVYEYSEVSMPRLTIRQPKLTVADWHRLAFQKLLSLSPTELKKLDIAELNLLSALGLPGSEDIDIPRCLDTLDEWAKHVAMETRKNFHQFFENPASFNNSEAYFRILAMITVLQQDYGVRYNPNRINDLSEDFFRDSKDNFIYGVLGEKRMGTCASMPVLYVAIGKRLGYPVKLVVTRGHVFARWDDGRERFNIEGTNRGLNCHPDEKYKKWPVGVREDEAKAGFYLKSMEPHEELAAFLFSRFACLSVAGRLPEARLSMQHALRLVPKHPDYLLALLFSEGKVRKWDAWQETIEKNIRESPVTRESIRLSKGGFSPWKLNRENWTKQQYEDAGDWTALQMDLALHPSNAQIMELLEMRMTHRLEWGTPQGQRTAKADHSNK